MRLIKDQLLIEKFVLGNNNWYKRSSCERIVSGEPYYHYHEIRFHGPYTVKGLRDWLDVIEAVEKEFGLEAAIDNDDDGSDIYAQWRIPVPYTDKEVAEAQKWLDENPYEPKAIKWRKPIPFTTGESHDHDYHDEDD